MALTLEVERTQKVSAANPIAPQTVKPVTGSGSNTSIHLLIKNAGPASADLLNLNGSLVGAGLLSRPERELFRAERLKKASFRVGKRAFDVVFAACALLVLLPVLLACALLIRAESSGPILFRQRRLGKGGNAFHIVKFRTMVPNAESVLNRVLESDPVARAEWEKDRKLRNDPRITRLGRFLRKSSLDELPQFWNVLVGDMSVVGPRPIVNAEIPFYKQAYGAYCAVRPGITGLWQISGRNDTGYGQRVELDCKYVSSWSALLDLRIVFSTVRTVLTAAGAY